MRCIGRYGSCCTRTLLGVVLPTITNMGSRSFPLPVYFTCPFKFTSRVLQVSLIALFGVVLPNIAKVRGEVLPLYRERCRWLRNRTPRHSCQGVPRNSSCVSAGSPVARCSASRPRSGSPGRGPVRGPARRSSSSSGSRPARGSCGWKPICRKRPSHQHRRC